MRFAFSAPSILAALEDPFNPDLVISRLSEDQMLARLFAADAGVWEKYTIQEHTLMVLGIFERFQISQVSESEKLFFRLFLALHDIGKPLAIEQTGDKKRQSLPGRSCKLCWSLAGLKRHGYVSQWSWNTMIF